MREFDARQNLTDQDLTEFETVAGELQEKWRKRSAEHSDGVLSGVFGTLTTKDFHSPRQAALVEKRYAETLKNADQMQIETFAYMVWDMTGMDERLKREQQPAIRKTRVTQWAYVFERMDKETDPNFDVNDAPIMNTSFLGDNSTPEMAKAAAELYERNEKKRVYFDHQYWLLSKRYQFVNTALWGFKQAFTTPQDAQELRRLLNNTNLTRTFQTQILEAVSANVKLIEARKHFNRK